MIGKGLGFIRNVNLAWLDAAAESRLRNDTILSMRSDLDQILSADIQGLGARRKTIDVLISIWHKTALVDQELYNEAIAFLPNIAIDERIWLHYGLTLLYYPFFLQTTAVVGQFARTGEPITRQAVKNRLATEIGHLGSLNRAAERLVASLVDWKILTHQSKGNIYIPQLQSVSTSNSALQCWILACALAAHSADQIPFPDLMRLPELFPFRLTITIDYLRKSSKFDIQKQGMWDMVGLSQQKYTATR
jgi:hypothetical protein